MMFDQIQKLEDVLTRLQAEEDMLARYLIQLDVPKEAMPSQGQAEYTAAVTTLRQYLRRVEELRQKLLVLLADAEMYNDMHQMPEIYGPPEFF